MKRPKPFFAFWWCQGAEEGGKCLWDSWEIKRQVKMKWEEQKGNNPFVKLRKHAGTSPPWTVFTCSAKALSPQVKELAVPKTRMASANTGKHVLSALTSPRDKRQPGPVWAAWVCRAGTSKPGPKHQAPACYYLTTKTSKTSIRWSNLLASRLESFR